MFTDPFYNLHISIKWATIIVRVVLVLVPHNCTGGSSSTAVQNSETLRLYRALIIGYRTILTAFLTVTLPFSELIQHLSDEPDAPAILFLAVQRIEDIRTDAHERIQWCEQELLRERGLSQDDLTNLMAEVDEFHARSQPLGDFVNEVVEASNNFE